MILRLWALYDGSKRVALFLTTLLGVSLTLMYSVFLTYEQSRFILRHYVCGHLVRDRTTMLTLFLGIIFGWGTTLNHFGMGMSESQPV